MEVQFGTPAALIIAGVVLILSGLFGIRVKFGLVDEKIEGWKRGILVAAGVLLILLGVALTPEAYSLQEKVTGQDGAQQAASDTGSPGSNEKSEEDEIPTPAVTFGMTPVPTIAPSPTPTATRLPLPGSTPIDMPSVLANITVGEGGIEKAAPWWKAMYSDGSDGLHDPSSPPGYLGCFGVAWNVLDADRTVIVFQQPRSLSFAPGGWYAQVCVDNDIVISPAQIAAIQADWLQKEYGGIWTVRIIAETPSSCGNAQNSLGTSFTPPAVFPSANLNEMRVFSHCPQSDSIQYEQIAVDDELAKVLKVCRTTTEDVTWQFEPYQIDGDVLQQYRSQSITVEPDCRIDFYVRDLYGEKLGLHIRKAGSPE